jgi:Ca2+-binding RTX toxin-like protein
MSITMYYNAWADLKFGNQDENTIRGGNGSDDVLGGFNRDFIFGGDGQDCIDGGSGNDVIVGGSHGDTLVGFEGSDLIFGSLENDTTADGYMDTIDCGPGEDEAWINVGGDADVVVNCEIVHQDR